MAQRTGLVVWGLAVCLPLEAAGLLALALGAYSYDSFPSAGEKALLWGWAILPIVILGMAVFSANQAAVDPNDTGGAGARDGCPRLSRRCHAPVGDSN